MYFINSDIKLNFSRFSLVDKLQAMSVVFGDYINAFENSGILVCRLLNYSFKTIIVVLSHWKLLSFFCRRFWRQICFLFYSFSYYVSFDRFIHKLLSCVDMAQVSLRLSKFLLQVELHKLLKTDISILILRILDHSSPLLLH